MKKPFGAYQLWYAPALVYKGITVFGRICYKFAAPFQSQETTAANLQQHTKYMEKQQEAVFMDGNFIFCGDGGG